jgi:hypothetical protein
MVIVVLVLASANNFPEPSPTSPKNSSPTMSEDESPTPTAESSPAAESTPSPSVENSPAPNVKSSPAQKLKTTYIVTSTSMEPTIKKGATVVYMKVPFQSLKLDDIIMFNQPNHPDKVIVARIVGINSSGLVTKGDHNSAANPWDVTAPLVIGKITQINNP